MSCLLLFSLCFGLWFLNTAVSSQIYINQQITTKSANFDCGIVKLELEVRPRLTSFARDLLFYFLPKFVSLILAKTEISSKRVDFTADILD